MCDEEISCVAHLATKIKESGNTNVTVVKKTTSPFNCWPQALIHNPVAVLM
jgi:hypothetical protein